MAQDFFSGKSASYGIGGTTYTGNDGWSVEESPTELRTDNTAGAGFADRIIGSKDATATIEMNWDASANPLDTPVNLYSGAVLTNLKLFLNGSSSPFWLFPSALVLSVSNPAKVNEKVSLTIKIGNKGTYSRPTGNFTPAAP